MPTIDINSVGKVEYLFQYERWGEEGPRGHVEGMTPPRYVTDRATTVDGQSIAQTLRTVGTVDPEPPASCRGDFYRRVRRCNGDRDARRVRDLEFDNLAADDVFAPLAGAINTRSSPPALFERSCTATTRTSTASVQWRTQNTVVWLSRGFDRPPSSDAVDRFTFDLEHVVDRVFDRAVKAGRLPRQFSTADSIDSTDVRTFPPWKTGLQKGCAIQPPKHRTVHGYGCTLRLDRAKERCRGFTDASKAPETAMHPCGLSPGIRRQLSGCLCSSAAVRSAGTIDHLLCRLGVVPVTCRLQLHETPTIRKDIEYRVCCPHRRSGVARTFDENHLDETDTAGLRMAMFSK